MSVQSEAWTIKRKQETVLPGDHNFEKNRNDDCIAEESTQILLTTGVSWPSHFEPPLMSGWNGIWQTKHRQANCESIFKSWRQNEAALKLIGSQIYPNIILMWKSALFVPRNEKRHVERRFQVLSTTTTNNKFHDIQTCRNEVLQFSVISLCFLRGINLWCLTYKRPGDNVLLFDNGCQAAKFSTFFDHTLNFCSSWAGFFRSHTINENGQGKICFGWKSDHVWLTS